MISMVTGARMERVFRAWPVMATVAIWISGIAFLFALPVFMQKATLDENGLMPTYADPSQDAAGKN